MKKLYFYYTPKSNGYHVGILDTSKTVDAIEEVLRISNWGGNFINYRNFGEFKIFFKNFDRENICINNFKTFKDFRNNYNSGMYGLPRSLNNVDFITCYTDDTSLYILVMSDENDLRIYDDDGKRCRLSDLIKEYGDGTGRAVLPNHFYIE